LLVEPGRYVIQNLGDNKVSFENLLKYQYTSINFTTMIISKLFSDADKCEGRNILSSLLEILEKSSNPTLGHNSSCRTNDKLLFDVRKILHQQFNKVLMIKTGLRCLVRVFSR
jgi:hypothetical protein